MKQKITETIRKIIDFLDCEAVRYVFTGGCTTLVNFLLFAFMTKILRIDVTVSNVTSVSISVLFAYVTNKLFVFRSHCARFSILAMEFVKFVGARLITMAVEIGGVYLFVNVIGQDSLVGKAETQIIVIAGNFFISKFIVFRQKAKSQE
jgi:putative flippase GtrA